MLKFKDTLYGFMTVTQFRDDGQFCRKEWKIIMLTQEEIENHTDHSVNKAIESKICFARRQSRHSLSG